MEVNDLAGVSFGLCDAGWLKPGSQERNGAVGG